MSSYVMSIFLLSCFKQLYTLMSTQNNSMNKNYEQVNELKHTKNVSVYIYNIVYSYMSLFLNDAQLEL